MFQLPVCSLGQEMANFDCKGLDSKYFRLYWLYIVCVATSQLIVLIII